MNTAAAGQPREWTYEMFCDNCRQSINEMDRLRWLVGDTALTIETLYGEHTMQDFSRDIGQNQSTVKGWKRVSRFYPESIRRNLLESNPNLTYTYYRDSLRLENFDAACEWLAEVSANGYTADEAAHKLTERLGHDTRKSVEGTVTRWYSQEDGNYLIVRFETHIDLRAGQVVSIRAK
jgi:hypothetical protein